MPFELQPAQIKLNAAIERCKAEGKAARIIYLKARQVMVSTAVAAQFFQRVPFRTGQRALIVAHDGAASLNLFGYYEVFADTYKPFAGVVGLPERKRSAPGSGMIEWDNLSYVKVATAGNLKSGRSFTLRYLHLSEYAFWPNAAALMTGLMQAVPDDPDTCVVIESTANGASGSFYERWQEASDPSSNSEWTAVFFAWWEHPQYRKTLADKASFQASLSEDELELQARYNLTLEQLAWRRWCIKTNCENSIDGFKQEYPSCPEEAFLYSGRPRFDHKVLSRMPVREDSMVGELYRATEQQGIKKPLVFLPNEDHKGALTVYKRPSKNKRYVIGIDVAEGIDASEAGRRSSGTAKNPDFSVASVLDGDTGEQVARLRGRIEPDPFAEYVMALAEWFNWAYLVPEANGPGIAFLEALLRYDFPTELVYKRHPEVDEQFKPGAYNSVQLLGWKTSSTNRVQLISGLDGALRDYSVTVVDRVTLKELRAFVIKANGKAEAQDGDHDDEVIALALAYRGLLNQPPDRRMTQIERHRVEALAAQGYTAPKAAGVRKYGERRQEERGRLIRW